MNEAAGPPAAGQEIQICKGYGDERRCRNYTSDERGRIPFQIPPLQTNSSSIQIQVRFRECRCRVASIYVPLLNDTPCPLKSLMKVIDDIYWATCLHRIYLIILRDFSFGCCMKSFCCMHKHVCFVCLTNVFSFFWDSQAVIHNVKIQVSDYWISCAHIVSCASCYLQSRLSLSGPIFCRTGFIRFAPAPKQLWG